MKITGVRNVLVVGPRRSVYGKVYQSALGASAFSEHGIVFIDTDEGITGIGEISSVFKRRGRLLCREVDLILGPALVGEDPLRIAYLLQKMERVLDGSQVAKAGLEMALYDIVGKVMNTPVYNLLGGQVRECIPLSFSIPFGEPTEMSRFARELVGQGYRTVKVKVGFDARRDIETVRSVREAIGPDVQLRVDANMAWRTPKEAIEMITAMEPYRLQLVEQPLQPRDLDGLAFIRQHVRAPIMADESVWTPQDAMEVIRRSAADIVNVYVSESGGLFNASRTFSMCEAAGIPCMIGSMPEFGLGTAACIHLGVAMTNLGLDSDTCGVLYHAEDLLMEPLRIEGGFAYPPTGPGLGVALNMDVLNRWRVQD
jgi:L-alanine-DL-glutamate epimerase-like enolase superfamily enzyme